jgi:hypothetical protein
MPSDPGMAKDRGRIELEIEGKQRCSGFWRTVGYALRDDGKVDRHVDLLMWRGADGRRKALPDREDDVLLLDDYPEDRPFAVSIAPSFRDDAEIIHDVVVDLGGARRSEWSGDPLTFSVREGEPAYPRAQDPTQRGAFVQVTRRAPDGATRAFRGHSGTVSLRRYDLRTQSFMGAVDVTLRAVDDPTVDLAVKGTIDIKLRD